MGLLHWALGRRLLGCSGWPQQLPHTLTTWSPSHMRPPLPVQGAAHCRAQELLGSWHSHGVIEHNILLGELQQHRIIEELADAHVFTQALQRMGQMKE